MIGSIALFALMGVLVGAGIWLERRSWERKRRLHLERTGYDFIDRE